MSRSLPKSIGLPCSRRSIRSSRTSRSVKARWAPSLKMLQFWRTSTNAEPLWRPACSSTFWMWSTWVSTVRATKVASAARAIIEGVDRVVDRPDRGRLGLLAELRGRRGLALRQAVDPVVEHDDLDVDVPPHRVEDVVAADRERVAVAGDHPDHELRAGELEAGGDRRRPAVDRVEAVGVHVVREAAGAADPADEDDVLAAGRRSRASPSGSGPGSSSRRSRGTSGVLAVTKSLRVSCGARARARRSGRRSVIGPRLTALAEQLLGLGLDLADPERLAPHEVEADGVDEVTRRGGSSGAGRG